MRLFKIAALITVVAISFATMSAQSFKVIYTFTGGADSCNPSYLTFDEKGNLYGTAGGDSGSSPYGNVFELIPSASGWRESTLYTFQPSGGDGQHPNGGVIFDKSGNLYGTTTLGGASSFGTLFELSPNADGWTETILHDFDGPFTDASEPSSKLTFDSIGNLYGSSWYGGINNLEQCDTNGDQAGCGTVFKFSSSGGSWAESALFSFDYSDGFEPGGPPAIGPDGNIYQTSQSGGAKDFGTLLRLSPESLTKTATLSFGNYDIHMATGALTFDRSNNLYGTSYWGGSDSQGSVYRITPKGKLTILHSFTGKDGDGLWPYAGVTLAGNAIYGSTDAGGAFGFGTLYGLTPSRSGWVEQILYSFQNTTDGAYPGAELVPDGKGNFYGTAERGADGCGVVYEITP
jgi:uncharacterized repeat protein (TIGR03803 family)